MGQTAQFNFILVVGNEEASKGTVNVRTRHIYIYIRCQRHIRVHISTYIHCQRHIRVYIYIYIYIYVQASKGTVNVRTRDNRVHGEMAVESLIKDLEAQLALYL